MNRISNSYYVILIKESFCRRNIIEKGIREKIEVIKVLQEEAKKQKKR